jgi:hypothetical protein
MASDKFKEDLPATNEAREFDARRLHVELEDKKDQRQFEYAKQNLQIVAADQEAWRQHSKETLHIRLKYYTALAFIVGVFSMVALLQGEKDLLLSLLHDLGLLFGGGGVGYFFCYRRMQISRQMKERRQPDE